jgi:hypothetical protein
MSIYWEHLPEEFGPCFFNPNHDPKSGRFISKHGGGGGDGKKKKRAARKQKARATLGPVIGGVVYGGLIGATIGTIAGITYTKARVPLLKGLPGLKTQVIATIGKTQVLKDVPAGSRGAIGALSRRFGPAIVSRVRTAGTIGVTVGAYGGLTLGYGRALSKSRQYRKRKKQKQQSRKVKIG